jgi:hypothetical protein
MGAVEFCWWKWLIQKEQSDQWLTHDRKDWQLAKIAHMVYVLIASVAGMFGGKVEIRQQLDDFLADELAKKSGAVKVKKRRTRRERLARGADRKRRREEQVALATAASQAKWFAAVGYDPNKK